MTRPTTSQARNRIQVSTARLTISTSVANGTKAPRRHTAAVVAIVIRNGV
jgi:hypothetical protein